MTKQTKIILALVCIAGVILLWTSGIGSSITLETVTSYRDNLRIFVDTHYVRALVLFILTYIGVTTLSIPIAALLTITSGFLFGTLFGALYTNIGATTGATCLFLASRYLLGTHIQKKYTAQLTQFNQHMKKEGIYYLLTIRMIVVIPFFIVNILAGLTTVPIRTFVWTTSLGIIPTSLVFAFAGQQLATVKSAHDILSGKIILAFVLLGLLALVPVLIKRLRKKDEK